MEIRNLEEANRALNDLLARLRHEQSDEDVTEPKTDIFSQDEVKTWLAQEPSFPKPIIRRQLTDNSSDEDLTEPARTSSRNPVIS